MTVNPEELTKESKNPSRPGRSAWFGGVVLIIVGLAFIVENMDLPFINHGNWWAMFFLIPIAALLDDIYRSYTSAAGSRTGTIISKLIGLLVLGTLMVIFLFGVNPGVYWPVLLIAAGLLLLIAALVK